MKRQFLKFASAMLCLSAAVTYGRAQETAFSSSLDAPSTSLPVPADALPDASMPDAPSAVLQAPAGSAAPLYPAASKLKRIVPADRTALPLSAGDKFALSFAGQVSLTGLGSVFLSAGWGQLTGGAPHYGSDRGAFGERLGAAEIKQASDAFFSYGLYASLFHDDPRYYVQGRKMKFSKRVVYAATRVIITRKDDGGSTVNIPRLAGIASATALTNAYYPEQDRTAGRNLSSFGTSIATTAGVNELNEFLSDAIHLVFHKH